MVGGTKTRVGLTACAAALFVVGCAPTDTSDTPAAPTVPGPAAANASAVPAPTEQPWFEPASLRHDFGVDVGATNSQLEHTYKLVNTSQQPVRIAGVQNEKPCCGDVRAQTPARLLPGESLDVVVTLHARHNGGKLQHAAVVQPEGRDLAPAVIETTATHVPRAAIDESSAGKRALLAQESAKVGLIVRCFGTKEHPPHALREETLEADGPIIWEGEPSTEEHAENGLVSTRRACVITLRAQGAPGPRTSEIVLRSGADELARHRIAWEVAPAIKASPSGLIIASDDTASKKFLLRSVDEREFQIVSTRAEGIEFDAGRRGNDARAVHTLEAQLRSNDGIPTGAAADIVVTTDHPLQPEVRITVFVTGPRVTARDALRGERTP